MRLDVVAPPYVADGGLAQAQARRHQPATPLGAPFGLGLQCGVDDPFDVLLAIGWLAAAARSHVPQPGQTLLQKTLPPEAHGLAIDLQFRRNRQFRLSRRRRQNDAATKRYLLRRSHRSQPLIELFSLLFRQDDARTRVGHEPFCRAANRMSSYLLDTTLATAHRTC